MAWQLGHADMHKWYWNSYSWHYWPCDIATHMRKVVATPRVIWVSLGPSYLMGKMANNGTQSKKILLGKRAERGRIGEGPLLILCKCTGPIIRPFPTEDPGPRLSECVSYLSGMSPTTTATASKPLLKFKKKTAQFVICKWIFLELPFLRPHLKHLFLYAVP